MRLVRPKTTGGDKVWAVLLTNETYLPGVLALAHSLRSVGSAYGLIVLYTDTLPSKVLSALSARFIDTQLIDYIRPANGPNYSNDPRFNDCWTKLAAFSLTQYERVVQLDADMLVLQNMDELMTLPLDSATEASKGISTRVLAAGHACVCNPLHKKHYPTDWVPSNCAFTTQHGTPETAHQIAPACNASPMGYLNGGLLVLVPSAALWERILNYMHANASGMGFADQSVLSELFAGRWVPLPYIYNALRTMRWEGVHEVIWRDDKVKNLHYILDPKPWAAQTGEVGMRLEKDPTYQWWVDLDQQRKTWDKNNGITDGL
ncbi:glycosyltransferase family 8 protein [Ceratocystis lukuohia]|uniref:Glycosyltransferase family 8 protein n=1 Tax=Ceratocystis lukuohia TaxID=2019550 RepID=A0ABR4MN74_9PEZI